MSSPIAVVDGILAAIEIYSRLSAALSASAARVQAGGELTPADRAALDLANAAQRDELLAAIAQRVGPDPADAPAIGDAAANEAAAKAQAGNE